MPRNDPFGFDMSAKSDKVRRQKGRRGMTGAVESSTRTCDHKGCRNAGQFRAPKSPEQLDEYLWFCRDHVRAYNLKWNFFQGQTDAEFQAFLDNSTVWERPTKPFGRKGVEDSAWQRLGVDDPLQILGANGTQKTARGTASVRKLPPTERRALDILEAQETWTKTEIRKQYKTLVKDLHPDMNRGQRDDEDRLQEVVWAWEQLKESRYFRD